jgi:hypothetical protein
VKNVVEKIARKMDYGLERDVMNKVNGDEMNGQ